MTHSTRTLDQLASEAALYTSQSADLPVGVASYVGFVGTRAHTSRGRRNTVDHNITQPRGEC